MCGFGYCQRSIPNRVLHSLRCDQAYITKAIIEPGAEAQSPNNSVPTFVAAVGSGTYQKPAMCSRLNLFGVACSAFLKRKHT